MRVTWRYGDATVLSEVGAHHVGSRRRDYTTASRHRLEHGDGIDSPCACVEEDVTYAEKLADSVWRDLADERADRIQSVAANVRLHLSPQRSVACYYHAYPCARLARKHLQRLA